MKQWEYFIFKINKDIKIDSLTNLLNDYGAGRWELVSVIQGNSYMLYHFKRERK